jgi:hypothetical protein
MFIRMVKRLTSKFKREQRVKDVVCHCPDASLKMVALGDTMEELWCPKCNQRVFRFKKNRVK